MLGTEVIIVIAVLIVFWLLLTALIKITKKTVTLAIAVAAIVLGLQLVLGIAPQDIWQEIVMLLQTIWQFVNKQLTPFLNCLILG